jgi:hypothetical protein
MEIVTPGEIRTAPVQMDDISNISLYLEVVDEDPLSLFEQLASLARDP